MFWKFDLHTTSHIDTLLDKEDVTLTELLDEDDVLQECKAQNRKLIDFLIRPEVMEELVNLITQDPPDDVEEKIRYKYPNTACELLTSDVSQINDKLGDDEALLNKLWAFLEAEPPLNPLLASFFSKVMGMLLARKTAMPQQDWDEGYKMLDFLRQKEDVVGLLITHLSTSAIMDLLLRLLTSVDAPELRTEMLQWLDDQKLIQRLIEVLDPTGDEEKHSNAAQSLCDIIRLSREHMSQLQEQAENDPLLTTMEKQETVEELLNVILNGEKTESALVNGISVLLTLLEFKKPGLQYFWSCSPDGQDQMTPLDAERLAQGVSSAILGITPRLKELHQLLIEPPKQRPMPTSVGTMDPPFGNTRLHVCRLMASLLLTNTHQVNIELANLGTLDIMLDCFFQYTWNNFLHTQVEQCINTILTNPPSDDSPNQEGNPEPKHPLINNLLGQSRIIQRILDKWEEDQQIESQGGNRRGYMGHLTRIANSLQTCLEKGPNKDLVKEIFKEVPEDYRERWETFVSGSLAEINKKNTVDLVGSHPLHSSSEDDDSDFKDIPFPPDSSLQQAFSDYQMQQMTSTFIDQFGFNDEEFADQEENVNAPFDRISDINFSTNANEENPNRALFEAYCKEVMSTIGPSTPNSALFEACCNERISTFDDSGSDEEDVWEEKELTFSSVVESRQSTISTTSNDQGSDGSDNSSDSEEDAEDTPSPLRSDKPPPPAASSPKPPGSPASPSASEDTKMDVDNSDGWTATFDEAPMDAAPVAMETGAGSWDDVVAATNKPGGAATDDGWANFDSVPPSKAGPGPEKQVEDSGWANFADFTPLGPSDSNNPQPRSSSPVAMETNEAPTDGLRKGVAYLMASAPPDLATSVQQSTRLPEVGESSTDPEDEFTSLRNSQPLANTVEAMNVDEPPQQTEQPNRTGGTEGKPTSDTRPAETGETSAEEKTGGAEGSREASETVQGSPAKDGSSSLKQGNSDRETRTSSSSPTPSPSASATKPPQPNTPSSVGDKDQSNNNTQHQQQQQPQGTEQGSPGNTNDPTEELSQNFNILSSGVTKTGKEGEEPKTAPPPGSPNTDNSHVNQTDPPTTENSVEMKIGAMETMRPEGTKPPVETLVPATGAANGPV
ncbi:PREDICTED: serine/threonine-protein phosphatase 6 regulatory subunit 3-like isoform X2 [Branchiostoma belcheri]|uniref:Serine/threonine-protein phosphatase 6 regulatory subunit 3-like isoform X2 n=1 Tax=Branchiostoma belcheri TaxID=7741 RepID=A0A6P4YG40_BRABE|nr:PREDICTED: serine/threonine-protein phosphatase 6 regulatory subunit 3-like isoform X2 [Branchiostoma belcheri]